MAGHSRWANIQRRESAQARRREREAGLHALAGLERVRFEGYGPGGAAVMVDCLTPDRVRSGAQVRSTFDRYGGNLGAGGSVSYLFNTVGLMTYPPGTDEEQLMRVALEAGAEDVVPSDDCSVEVLADPLEFDTVRAVLIHSGFAPATAEVTQRAATPLELSGESAELMVNLLVALEELDEVQDVYSNVEISDEVLARI
jgi:transcriptional/translational regulatory protein YebC/TACO1